MTTSISCQTLWDSYLSPQEEVHQKKIAQRLELSQQGLIVTVIAIAIAILVSPFLTPISYLDVLMQGFAWAPVLTPLPYYAYAYLSSQIHKTQEVVEKILFLRNRKESLQDLSSPLEMAITETFSTTISPKKKETFAKNTTLLPILLSHIDFFTQKIHAWEEEKKELEQPLSTIEKNFSLLHKEEILAPWNSLILQKKQDWIANHSLSTPESVFKDIMTEIEKEPDTTPNKAAALQILQRLYWQSHNSSPPSFEQKWITLFNVSEKIYEAKIQRIFLFSLLLQTPEETLLFLQKYQLDIEKGLYDIAQKRVLSLPELAIAEKHEDPAAQKYLLFLQQKAIFREDILDPHKAEELLDKILLAQKNRPFKDIESKM